MLYIDIDIYILYLYMCTMALDSYIFNLDISVWIGQASGQTHVGHSLWYFTYFVVESTQILWDYIIYSIIYQKNSLHSFGNSRSDESLETKNDLKKKKSFHCCIFFQAKQKPAWWLEVKLHIYYFIQLAIKLANSLLWEVLEATNCHMLKNDLTDL